MADQRHSMDPVRKTLREFETAVRTEAKKMMGSKVMERQSVDRARERVIESVMELVRNTLKERGVE